MASAPLKWNKSKENFIEYLYNQVVSKDPELRKTDLSIWLEKYENDNKFKKLVDSKNIEKLERFIAHQKYAFQCLLEKNPNHQSYAGKIGGPLGGEATWEKLVDEYGEEDAKQIVADRLYNSQDDEWKAEFHSKGGNTTQEKYGAGFHLKEYAKKDPDQIKRAQQSSLKKRKIKKDAEKKELHNALPEGWFYIKELNVSEYASGKQLSRWIYDEKYYDVDCSRRPARFRKHHGNSLNLPNVKVATKEWRELQVTELYKILPESFTQEEIYKISKQENLGNNAPSVIIKDRSLTSVYRPKNADKTKSKILLPRIYTKLK